MLMQQNVPQAICKTIGYKDLIDFVCIHLFNKTNMKYNTALYQDNFIMVFIIPFYIDNTIFYADKVKIAFPLTSSREVITRLCYKCTENKYVDFMMMMMIMVKRLCMIVA